ncbi:MAG: HAMP domain-containing histidine kinase [Clostridia bacterium]|nr:HAMP domain-containing histidine kinase [Clostridia bacterium]
MKKQRRSGLFRKYFFITMAIILIAYLFAGASLMLMVSGVWLNERLEMLDENATNIRDSTEELLKSSYLEGNSRGSVIMICNNLLQISGATDADYFIVNELGQPVYCKDLIRPGGMIDSRGECLVHSHYQIPDTIIESLKNGETYSSSGGDLGGHLVNQSFIVAVPIMAGDTLRGAVVATKPIATGLVPYVSTILTMFFISFLASFIIAFVLVYISTARMVRPLRQMSLAAKQYALGDFSNRINIRSRTRTEIDELADSFNSMANDLSDLEMSRRSFVSNVSHELKTPMTSISGFIDGILDGTIPDSERDKYLGIVSDEVKRLSRLVTGMLNMSKIEAGKIDIKPVKFDISEMLFNTLLTFEQKIDGKNIEIKGLEDIGKNEIYADKDMINQVVYNLIDNAVKFTPESGYIEINSKRDAEKAIVKIRNSGAGIEPDEIERIFERFYKIDKSRSYDVKGAGLGLYLCKTIVELHGGDIIARSELNEYTEFIFRLPLI